MNRSYSKIRHIQESNLRLEKRMLSEQVNPELEENNPFNFGNGFDDYDFPEEIKERLMSIHDLLDEAMEDPENDPSNYEDMYDFASIIIGDVIHKLNQEFGEEFEEYEDDVEDYLKNNEDEYIFAFHESHSDFDDDEYNF